MGPLMTFTGTDVHRALQAWQRLSDNQRDTWAAAARLHVARGETTTAAAEFVAARLKQLVARRIREGKK